MEGKITRGNGGTVFIWLKNRRSNFWINIVGKLFQEKVNQMRAKLAIG